MTIISKIIIIRKEYDQSNLCGDIGGTLGSAGESRGEILRGPDHNEDDYDDHVDNDYDDHHHHDEDDHDNEYDHDEDDHEDYSDGDHDDENDL